MILIDTSVWIDHLRHGLPGMMNALQEEKVLMHPLVRGELACGNLKNRQQILRLLGNLPKALTANDDEALAFIEGRALMGRGVGYIDVHLLASAALTNGARLWTADKRLAALARELDLGFQPAPPA